MSNINLELNGHKFSCGPVEKALFLVDPNEALNALTNRLAMVMKADAEDGAENFTAEQKDQNVQVYGDIYKLVSGKSPWQVEKNVDALLAQTDKLRQIKADMGKITGQMVEKPFSFFKAASAQAITENKASILDSIRAGLEV